MEREKTICEKRKDTKHSNTKEHGMGLKKRGDGESLRRFLLRAAVFLCVCSAFAFCSFSSPLSPLWRGETRRFDKKKTRQQTKTPKGDGGSVHTSSLPLFLLFSRSAFHKICPREKEKKMM